MICEIQLQTNRRDDMLDITEQVEKILVQEKRPPKRIRLILRGVKSSGHLAVILPREQQRLLWF